MNGIFPVDLLNQILLEKKANVSGEIVTNDHPENKDESNKITLDSLGNETDSNEFDAKLTNFLMSSKQKHTRSEKIDRAAELGLVE